MAAVALPRSRLSRGQQIDAVWGYLFVAAPLLGFLIFAAGPLVASLFLSFTEWNLLSDPEWVGLENWRKLLFDDPIVWQAMGNTAFLLLGIPISMAIALFLASMMNQPVPGSHVFRVIYYMPTVLTIAALSLLWLWVLNPDYGLFNNGLRSLGMPAAWTRLNWWQDRNLVKPAFIIMGIWRGVGYQALVYLAALQGVQRTLYEAAEIDGANAWQKFWAVTWPALTPTTFFLLITALIGGFQIFVEPAIMTNGGPANASITMVMLIWKKAFRDFAMGYASAQAWLLGVIIMTITIANFLLARRWVFTEQE
ncbi:MAG: sugar ABC transporter permease [Chloroflexi bacterium]|nr:sugar ABC transporter permease [Chloroflexota bacterium]MCI0574942.1 sugar ABC transporter permease [Chloroflexota bacterium]MCI0645852.1 sugar ABC transporter permease [Chloroflexota bacterium]MCI0725707.1 sugar ABC transporter permease [Chloroflexota bacterium]